MTQEVCTLRQEGTCFHRTHGRKLANVEGSDLNDLRLRGIARAQSDTLKTPTQGQEVENLLSLLQPGPHANALSIYPYPTYLHTRTRLVSKTREPEDVSQDIYAAGERRRTSQARARRLAKCPTRVQARAHT